MAETGIRLAIATAIVSLCTAAPARPAAELSKDRINAISQCIAIEAQRDGFSGAISIMGPSGTITSFENGLVAGAGSPAISQETQFNLGSAGKMFTAVAVAQLVEAKKIGFDDQIGRYVKGLTTEASAVTIRQLLTHSGGLGNFFTPDNLSVLKTARRLTDLKPLVVGDRPSFVPGTEFAYSNSGFLLLGLMVETVSGLSFPDYLTMHVFAPAGMVNASVLPAAMTKRAVGMTRVPELPPFAPGQMRGQGGGPPLPPPSGTSGMQGPPPPPPNAPLRPAVEAALVGNSAGGTYASAADMHRFFAAFLAGKLTSQEMRDTLLSPQINVLPPRDGKAALSHGLGFALSAYGGQKWFGHNGGTLGVNVELMAFPDDQIQLVVLTNRDPPTAMMFARKLLTTLFDDKACAAQSAQ